MTDCVQRPTLRGDRVLLRAPRPGDIADRIGAGRDAEYRRMIGATPVERGPMTEAEARDWYADVCNDALHWIIEHDGRCVGVVRLHGVDMPGRTAHLAIGIFRPDDRGRGLGTDALTVLLRHAFDGMGLFVIHVRVLAFNRRALAAYARCGFEEVGREQTRIGEEQYEDVLLRVYRERLEAARPRLHEPVRYYHGTKAALQPGDLIAPGYRPNFGKLDRVTKYVYFTATLDAATWGAELATGDGRGRIYVVEPTGPIEDDPNLTDKKFPGNPTRSYRTRDPLRVTGEITDWQGHSPEALKAMRDGVERMRELGVEPMDD